MNFPSSRLFRVVSTLLVCLTFAACTGKGGSGAGGGAGAGNPNGTNRARFTFAVDLQGVTGQLVMDLEAIGNSGITWGPGVNPQITGVIGTGTYTIYTAGELTSPTAHYVFTGENQFADFTDLTTSERFRVQWIETQRGLIMVVNPFGPGPVSYECVLTGSQAR
ncbi:MAG: hypothetical protein IPM29_09315 [Planctomycetes bacterium]|nr:hypothetical protein [Planctomycetota bacterium]